MPKRNNRNRRRRPRGRRSRNAQQFYAPMLRNVSLPDSLVTLTTTQIVGSGVSAVNGFVTTLNWNFLKDVQAMAYVYRYFEVVGFKVDFTLSTTTAAQDSFNEGGIAFLPINYLIEGVPTSPPTDVRSVLVLPGAVNVQPGASNKGPWFKPDIKQQFSTSDAFSTSLVRAMGVMVGYFDDLGVSETVGFMNLKANLRFYARDFTATNPTYNFDRTSKDYNFMGSPSGKVGKGK